VTAYLLDRLVESSFYALVRQFYQVAHSQSVFIISLCCADHSKGPSIIKLFTSLINSAVQQASAFVIVSHFLGALTNTSAFFVTELSTAVKSFMTSAPRV
jgi:hypothetical protein